MYGDWHWASSAYLSLGGFTFATTKKHSAAALHKKQENSDVNWDEIFDQLGQIIHTDLLMANL